MLFVSGIKIGHCVRAAYFAADSPRMSAPADSSPRATRRGEPRRKRGYYALSLINLALSSKHRRNERQHYFLLHKTIFAKITTYSFVAAFSFSASFLLNRILPVLSISITLTRTSSPSWSTSVTFSILLKSICDM